ncbi:30762_t:CDS:2 [Gigaspora margarita]|uniref:30762_t:CDS:1 n=1 Tax=Gigaspora margarita TaxID=4874 RepID=A0ABM8VZL5_GIGMA|nr:30762_t:CDS:2 [Gigaspora margarita]
MTLNIVNLEDGRWVTSDDYGDDSININCEPHSLLEHESEAISSVTNHFLGGVQGYVSYIIEDDMSSQFIISWEVSPIGSQKYYFSFLDESYMQDYQVNFEYSLGNTIYQVKIDKKTSLPMSWLISIFLFVFFITIPFFCYQCMTSGRKVDGTIGQQGQSSYNNFNSNDQPPPYHQLFP